MLFLKRLKPLIPVTQYFLAIVFLLSSTVLASEKRIDWVTAEGAAPIIDGDVKLAKDLAIKLAHQDAIRKSMCQDISIESLTVNLRLSGSLAGSIPHCRITESKVLSEERDTLSAHAKIVTAMPIYRLKIKASLIEVATKADPRFKLKAQLNHTRFYEGDEMVVRVVPTMSIYCYIYVVLEDGRIIQLMPNHFGSHKRIRAGQTLMFPDANEINRGFTLKTQLPVGKRVTTETVYILAVKASAKHALKNKEALNLQPYEDEAGFFEQLVAKIATIPENQRCEKILPYQIVKREP